MLKAREVYVVLPALDLLEQRTCDTEVAAGLQELVLLSRKKNQPSYVLAKELLLNPLAAT